MHSLSTWGDPTSDPSSHPIICVEIMKVGIDYGIQKRK